MRWHENCFAKTEEKKQSRGWNTYSIYGYSRISPFQNPIILFIGRSVMPENN